MKTVQQVWEEAYPDRRKWEALDQDTRNEWERVVKVAQEDMKQRMDMLEMILMDRCFFTGDRKEFDRQGCSLLVEEETAIRSINYRNAPLHVTFDDALEAAIEFYQQ